jgi:hypothetical protein
MGLDYDGKPVRGFKRILKDSLSQLSETDPSFFKDDVVEDEAAIFNELAKVLMKGAKLKAGLGDMDPAGFIPVEEGARVVASIQRVGSSNPIDRISFGLFKEACEFLTSRNSAIDEEFLMQFEFVDYELGHTEINAAHKGKKKDTGKDWITQFLDALSPMAGLMLSSYFLNLAGTNQGKPPTPDGPDSTGTQVQQQNLLGVGVGIALLIELGTSYSAFNQVFSGGENILNEDLQEQYEALRNDPAARKQVLEDVGYDYEALVQNKKFDDYKAIKTYALEYISSRSLDLRYDHWIAWANVVENQEMITGSLAMAPMFSKKWKIFGETNDVSVFNSELDVGAIGGIGPEETDFEDDLVNAAKEGLVTGLKNYFGSVLTVSDDHYNKAAQTYSMQIDARLMCCIVWFLGPLDTSTLKRMSELMRLLALNTRVNFKDLISRLIHDALAPVLSMMVAYLNKMVHGFFNDLMSKLLNIKKDDWGMAIQKCIGIEILYGLIEKFMLKIVEKLQEYIDELNGLLDRLNGKATAMVEISAERRWMITMAAMIDAIVDKLDKAMETCQQPEGVDAETANDLAAEAAVTFASVELPTLYPLLNLSEDVRRKFFSNTTSFKTSDLGLDVPAFGSNGEIEDFSEEQANSDCGAGGRALKGILIGQKIADSMNNK